MHEQNLCCVKLKKTTMRINKITIVALVVMLLGCDAGNRVDPVFEDYFIKYYGEDGNQEGVDIYVNDDDSMILLGNSSSLTDKSKPFIVKTDSEGNVLWQRQMGERDETAVDVELITQGAYQGKLVVISNVGTGDLTRVRVTIVDQDGHGVDSLVVGSSVKQVAKSVSIASNNDFLISGYIAPDPDKNLNMDNADDTADVMCLRLSQSFQTSATPWVWQGGQYRGSGEKAFEVMLQDTVKYVIFGWSDTPLDDAAGVFEDKFDVSVVSVKGIPANGSTRTGLKGEEQTCSQAIRVPAAQEDGFFLIGTSTSGPNSNIYIAKYSKDLTVTKLYQKLLYGQKMEGVAVANAVQDEGYFLLADAIQDNNNSNIFLVHIRFDGSEVWTSTFGTDDGDDRAGAVAALKDGRVAVLGTMDLETQKKMALIIVTQKGGFSN